MLADVARFLPDDPDELVEAAFACPFCLSGGGIEWQATLVGYDPSVQCACESCHERWLVYLTPEQALRLSVLHHHHRH
jgi:hypothetical protein